MSQVENKRIWAVVCGSIRLEFELYTTLARLCQMQKEDVIERILLSTWKDEVEKIVGLRDRLAMLGVSIIESSPIEDNKYKSDLNYIRQQTQMQAALQFIPDDVYVLKCRTDYSNFDLNRMQIEASDSKLLQKQKFGEFSNGLEKTIKVLRYGATCPFTFHDICYLGYAKDLKYMQFPELSALRYGYELTPDVQFWIWYYIHRYPFIDQFLKRVNLPAFQKGMVHLRKRESFYLPKLLIKFYALYFVILYTSFELYHHSNESFDEVIAFDDVFYGSTKYGIMNQGWCIDIRDERVIRSIVQGNVQMTSGYKAMYDEIQLHKQLGYAETLTVSDEEVIELEQWMNVFFETGSEGVTKKKPDIQLPIEKSFEEAFLILGADYKITKESMSCIHDISFSEKSYYGLIVKNLDYFRETDYQLYKAALFASTRYLDDHALKLSAELLFDENCSEFEKEAAAYPFRRYAHEGNLHCANMSEERREAIELYEKYEALQKEE